MDEHLDKKLGWLWGGMMVSPMVISMYWNWEIQKVEVMDLMLVTLKDDNLRAQQTKSL